MFLYLIYLPKCFHIYYLLYLKAGMAVQRGASPQSEKKSVARPFEPGTDPHSELGEAGWWF